MELKEYQHAALERVKRYLVLLSEWKQKAEEHPDLEIDFPARAWDKMELYREHRSRENGIGERLPTFCLKIPTGGGKTLLAVKTIDLACTTYLRRRTGLVLWIVPTTQIYRQTIQSLRDRDHPYRQHLDLASGGRTVVLEKTDRFSPQEVAENLVVLMLMLPSANRQTKETLRVFRDSGGFQAFFPTEDDTDGQKELLEHFPNLDTFEAEQGFWGSLIKTSLGNTLRMLSPLIILDEGHKAYSEGAQATLRGFNPCMIVELSATPPKQSNILVDIGGAQLNREEMIKLDLHVINKASVDWRDTLLAAHNRLEVLQEKARDHEAATGTYIRPMCLIQVERTGKTQRDGKLIHSEDVREHLIKVIGVPEEEVAVKTAQRDELKDVDDVGGLMSRDCRIRYIITKQALQEGWDCAFAYVLAILTNPASKNALTQLVGRILRQPYARKTGVTDLDESYVFCFQQRARTLLDRIRAGFQREGLGDLSSQVITEQEDEEGGEMRQLELRPCFKNTVRRTILPVFVVRDGRNWRPVNYEMDIVSRIPWEQADLNPVRSMTLSMVDDKDVEHVTNLATDPREVLREKEVIHLAEGGIRVDPVFMTRQLAEVVPNPWQAHEFASSVIADLMERFDAERVRNNFVHIISELRSRLDAERDRLAEDVFNDLMEQDKLRFLLIGQDMDFSFPETMRVPASARTLARRDNTPLQRSLFDFVPEDQFNSAEKAVAWYLEDQEVLFFWYRNRARHDYGIQGWKRHRIYPDFIFTTADPPVEDDYQCVYVLETKGLHLKDSADTVYKERVFAICNREAKRRDWNELAPTMKDKVLRFDVLSEDEWQNALNSLLYPEDAH
jgi:type III restriction enzyme